MRNIFMALAAILCLAENLSAQDGILSAWMVGVYVQDKMSEEELLERVRGLTAGYQDHEIDDMLFSGIISPAVARAMYIRIESHRIHLGTEEGSLSLVAEDLLPAKIHVERGKIPMYAQGERSPNRVPAGKIILYYPDRVDQREPLIVELSGATIENPDPAASEKRHRIIYFQKEDDPLDREWSNIVPSTVTYQISTHLMIPASELEAGKEYAVLIPGRDVFVWTFQVIQSAKRLSRHR